MIKSVKNYLYTQNFKVGIKIFKLEENTEAFNNCTKLEYTLYSP